MLNKPFPSPWYGPRNSFPTCKHRPWHSGDVYGGPLMKALSTMNIRFEIYFFKLKYSWICMLCQFLLYSKGTQSYMWFSSRVIFCHDEVHFQPFSLHTRTVGGVESSKFLIMACSFWWPAFIQEPSRINSVISLKQKTLLSPTVSGVLIQGCGQRLNMRTREIPGALTT